jgi:hypothetical protein
MTNEKSQMENGKWFSALLQPIAPACFPSALLYNDEPSPIY